ncbi:MAG TPA: carboxypeptidase regulatory-like domain-containing protein [Candidatus Acidoferrum sp.]|nr:carboxypeptidase regulatory-like domain-containing protein [Candidatus Acidoferrum sp.]
MKGHGHSFYPASIVKNLPKAARLLVCAMIAILCTAFVAKAQDTGYISGTVTDKSGSAVAGADVVISSTNGSSKHATTTNAEGAYVTAGLPGGSYDLVVTAKGFQKYTAKDVVLDVAQKLRVDVVLTVGAVTEEVVVTGESVAQVETQSSALSDTITGKQVNDLVLNGRNFTQLVTLSPGVVNQTGTDEGKVGVYGNVAFSMNGGRTEYNNWELDGGDNMDNGSNATLNVYPNPEAIAEFKVLTSNYGAQYGRNGSGTVEVETKSGGTTFHGSAFEYLRNAYFNARSWAQGATPDEHKAAYNKNDFGYTFGGPVYIPNHYNTDKKKTFVFWSQEWRREKSSTTIGPQNVPSDAERSGNFADLCPDVNGTVNDCPTGPGVSAAHTVTPTATGTALLAIIPQANTTNGGFPAVVETVASPTTWREELVRVDQNLSDNYHLTFRYIHDSWQTTVPNALWGNGTSFQNITTNFTGPGSSFVARLNANITPTLLNEFVASYTADHITLTAGGPVGLPAGFSMGSIFNNGFGGKLPAISVGSNAAYGGTFTSDTGYFPWHNANPTYTYRDNVTKIIGQHSLQFGAYAAFAQKNEGNSPYVQGILTFDSGATAVTSGNAFADLLLGNIASYQQTSEQTQYYNRYKIVEPYFQDDWRVTKRLTLNLGLRVSLFGTYREKYQQAYNFNPSAFVAGGSPAIDASSGAFVAGAGNPFNGIVQCGGAGGTSAIPAPVLAQFPGATVGSSSNAGCLQGHLFNPAPRIGFAFDPKGDGKMAIRGGYGIFYEHTNGNEGNTESLEGSAPLVLTAAQSNILGYNNIGAGTGAVPFFPLTVVSIPNKAQWPYVQQWNLNVQKELPAHFIVSVAYVGSKGTHLTLLSNGNQIQPLPASQNPFGVGETLYNTGILVPDPTTGVPTPVGACAGSDPIANPGTQWAPGQTVFGTNGPLNAAAANNLNVACGLLPTVNTLRTAYPGYGNVNTLRNAANSIYNSLQVSARRTVGALTVSLAYTYSHSIDDSSDRGDSAFVNAYDIAANRASSTFDMRHNLAISYVYAMPFFKGTTGLKQTLLGGWQVSGITVAQSGTPFSVTNGTPQGDNAGVANGTGTGSRPDLVGNPHAGLTSTEVPGDRGPLAYNPAAYAVPQGLTFGDVGRNTLTLPGRVNFDFGAFKQFAINERMGFEFRWETFNVFNHTQYNQISGNNSSGGTGASAPMDTIDPTASAVFLHLTGTHDPRIMQFGLRFYF